MLSVAVVVRTRLSPACPHLLFRGATLFRTRPSELDTGWRTGSREVPLDSNLLSSDGSPIGPRWDHTPDSVRLNHGPYRSRDAGQTAAICLTLGFRVAAPDLPGITRPHRRRCDETEVSTGERRTTPQPTRLAPSRTLA
jgi:hypothetical protein